jgi:catechol 2,3-dioxygenase-like lactoylglutathione lyase family enzyme
MCGCATDHFKSGSGDVGHFILQQAVASGANPVSSNAVSAVSGRWRYFEDGQGVVIRMGEAEYPSLESFLIQTFGTPMKGPNDTPDGGKYGVYRFTSQGGVLQFWPRFGRRDPRRNHSTAEQARIRRCHLQGVAGQRGSKGSEWIRQPFGHAIIVVTGLNHVTLSVSDLERSVAFYSELLGFCVRMRGPSSACLEAGTLWLALVLDSDVRRGPLTEYSHFAFTVAPGEFGGVTSALKNAGVRCWQDSERSDSFYFLDPDGHKLELHTGDLRRRLDERTENGGPGVRIYD